MTKGLGGKGMRPALLLFAAFLMLGVSGESLADPPKPATRQSQQRTPDATVTELRALLQTPESGIDLAKAKLAIDRMIDSKVDPTVTLLQLDTLTTRIKARFPTNATSQSKLELLVNSLSQAGPWNDYRPFSYDLNDPFGKTIHNKLLSTYLTTRKGNCVSMPVLLVILGQKLGLDMTLATAPEHVLAKFRNDRGQWINIEATSFGTKSNASYEQETNISPKAVANRLYLRPLNKRESVAVMLSTLMEFYGQQQRQEQRIAIADLALQADPKDIAAMLQKGNAYFRLMQQYMAKYPSPAAIPPEQRLDFDALQRSNDLWFNRAEALGWTMPPKTQDANYLQTIQHAKATQQGGR